MRIDKSQRRYQSAKRSHVYVKSVNVRFRFLHVSIQEGDAFANDRGLLFTETSALSGRQVSELLLATGKTRR